MAYIGKEPQFTQYPSKFFDGDNSAMTVTLDYAPPNDAALLVFIDGVRQDTDAYNLVGTSLTFTGAVPTGTNNVQVVHMGLTVDVGVPGDATVEARKLSTSGTASSSTFLRGDMAWTVLEGSNITTQNTFFKNWNAVTATQTTTIASSENAAIIGTPAITVNNGVTWTIVGTLQLL
tara:strand:+ start:87 stop:614 length:528 start_codon:yes stop_codon:yes gene_type:complete